MDNNKNGCADKSPAQTLNINAKPGTGPRHIREFVADALQLLDPVQELDEALVRPQQAPPSDQPGAFSNTYLGRACARLDREASNLGAPRLPTVVEDLRFARGAEVVVSVFDARDVTVTEQPLGLHLTYRGAVYLSVGALTFGLTKDAVAKLGELWGCA